MSNDSYKNVSRFVAPHGHSLNDLPPSVAAAAQGAVTPTVISDGGAVLVDSLSSFVLLDTRGGSVQAFLPAITVAKVIQVAVIAGSLPAEVHAVEADQGVGTGQGEFLTLYYPENVQLLADPTSGTYRVISRQGTVQSPVGAYSADIVVNGAGSAGGTLCHQLCLRMPFWRVLCVEAGTSLPNPEARKSQYLSHGLDDVLRGIPYFQDPKQTNYATDPDSPYFGSGFPFSTPISEQGMGKGDSGTSGHNGGVAGTGSGSDYNKWDYKLRDGGQRFYPPNAALGPWPAIADSPVPVNTAVSANAAALLWLARADVGAPDANGVLTRQVWVSAHADPQHPNGVPMRVVALPPTAAAGNVLVESNPTEGIPGTAGAEPLVCCTPWNRSRMSRVALEVFDTIDTAFVGAGPTTSNPNGLDPLVHNSRDILPHPYAPDAVGFKEPYVERGFIGARSNLDNADATRWIDQRPGVATPRQSVRALAGINSLSNSEQVAAGYPYPEDGAGGFTFPYHQDATGLQESDPRDYYSYTIAVHPVTVGSTVVLGNSTTGAYVTLTGVAGAPGAGQFQVDPGGTGGICASIAAAATAAGFVGSASVFNAGGTSVRIPKANCFRATFNFGAGEALMTPWGRSSLSPLNVVGFNSDVSDPLRPNGQPVAGGRGLARIGRYDKYDDRRSTAVTSLDKIRGLQIVTLTADGGIGYVADGDLLTDGTIDGTAITAEARTQQLYAAQLAYAALQPGDVLDSVVPAGKQATVIQTSVVLDSTFTPVVSILVSLNGVSDAFADGDTFERTASALGGGTITDDGGALPLTVTQRVQVNMTDADTQFTALNTVSAATLPSGTVNSTYYQFQALNNTWADRVLMEPKVGEFDLKLVNITAPNDLDEIIVGQWSGARAQVLSGGAIGGAFPAAVSKVRVRMLSGRFQVGEPVEEAGATWTADALAQVHQVQQVVGVVAQREVAGGLQEVLIDTPRTVAAMSAYGSPLLLFRSGIGAQERLAPIGVPQLVDLPGVGDRATNHPIFTAGFWWTAVPDGSDTVQYLLQTAGVYRSSQNRAGLGYELGTNNPDGALLFDDDYEVLYDIVAFGLGQTESDPVIFGNPLALNLFNKQSWASEAIIALAGGFPLAQRLSLAIVLDYRSNSRGTGVWPTGKSVYDLPELDQGLYNQWQAKDAEAQLEAADQLYTKLSNSYGFGPAIPHVIAPVSGFEVPSFAETVNIPFATPPAGQGLTAARLNSLVGAASAAYHMVGTLGMGADSDDLAVCDERGRVRHVEGLWACDGSIYPEQLGYNPHGPLCTIAHNMAVLISEDSV